jgi:hypothetical protein
MMMSLQILTTPDEVVPKVRCDVKIKYVPYKSFLNLKKKLDARQNHSGMTPDRNARGQAPFFVLFGSASQKRRSQKILHGSQKTR